MTIRFLFDRMWQYQLSKCGKQNYARNNPFFLTSSEVQKHLSAVRAIGENNNSICFASREEARRQAFLYLKRLKLNERTIGEFLVRLSPERAQAVIDDLKPFYRDFSVTKDTLIEALCDE